MFYKCLMNYKGERFFCENLDWMDALEKAGATIERYPVYLEQDLMRKFPQVLMPKAYVFHYTYGGTGYHIQYAKEYDNAIDWISDIQLDWQHHDERGKGFLSVKFTVVPSFRVNDNTMRKIQKQLWVFLSDCCGEKYTPIGMQGVCSSESAQIKFFDLCEKNGWKVHK